MNFDKLYEGIEDNWKRRESGELFSIPPPFKRIGKSYGGWMKGTYYCITAGTSVGKSKLAKYLGVLSSVKTCKEAGLIPKIFYFALEESEKEFWLNMMSYWIHENYGQNITVKQLQSIGDRTLKKEFLGIIKESKEFIEDLQQYVEVIDWIYNPTGMAKHIKAYFDQESVGRWETIDIDGRQVNKSYTYRNPKLWVFGIFDHLSLMHAERQQGVKMDRYQTFDLFSKDYCQDLFCKKLQMVTIAVHQQTPQGEKLQYTNRGELIEEALEPTLDNLHINKSLEQDYDIVMGLYEPQRHGIQDHRGYKIGLLGKSYRSLKFLKDRHFGLAGDYVGLQFNGVNGIFKELPSAKDLNSGAEDYGKWKL